MTGVTIGTDRAVNALDMNETLESEGTQLDPARELVAGWIDAISTEPIPKGKAIDDLLDLRGLLNGNLALRLEVDRHLRKMPGKRIVDATWWAETTAHLHSLINRYSPA